MKTAIRAAFLAGACLLAMAPSGAQTIASKIELMGQPSLLQFTGLRMREQNRLLHIQAEITNQDTRAQRAYYRVQWLDESGFQVWDDEAWKPVLLHGAQKLTLQLSAPTTKARDFTIQFSAEDKTALGQSGISGNTP